MLQLDFWAMGCQMRAATEVETTAAEWALRAIPAQFELWEGRLSRFRPDSELSQMNLRAGDWVRVSGTLYDLIQRAREMAAATEGLVDPTILPALELSGYDRPFAEMQPRELRPAPPPELPAGLWSSIELDPDRSAVRVPEGTLLDLGGVAKGWAAAKSLESLHSNGPALVDAGGDIALAGPREDGAAWPIDVADPWQEDGRNVGQLWVASGFVATSGRDRRRWRTKSGWRHHLIDPRSGQPAVTDALTATVVAPDWRAAEAAAKAALILGRERGRSWIEQHPGLEGLLLLEDGGIVTSSGLDQYQWRAW